MAGFVYLLLNFDLQGDGASSSNGMGTATGACTGASASACVVLSRFFTCGCVYTAVLALGCAIVYPDVPYVTGDKAVLTRLPTCAGETADGPGGVRGVMGIARSTSAALRRVVPELRRPRYWGFCLTFGWGALIQQWAEGAVGAELFFADAGDAYLNWAVPALTNATFLFTPLFGAIIDRHGFRLVGVGVLTAAVSVVLTLWVSGGVAQYASLLLICMLAAGAYTLQFAYLTMAFPPDMYSGLLTVTLLVQGCLGFIAWPLLAEVRPFGPDPSLGNFVLMLLPATLLFAWPLLVQSADDERLRKQGVIGRLQRETFERRHSGHEDDQVSRGASLHVQALADLSGSRATEAGVAPAAAPM